MKYLCQAKQRIRMIASAIIAGCRDKNECPIEGHPFLPNKKSGILLVHLDGAINNFSKQKRKRKYFQGDLKETVYCYS